MPLGNPKFEVNDVVKWTDDYGPIALKVGRIVDIKEKPPSRMYNGGVFYRIKLMNDPSDKRIHTVPEDKLGRYGSTMENVKRHIKKLVKEEIQNVLKEDDDEELHSFEEIYTKYKFQLINAFNKGNIEEVMDVFHDAMTKTYEVGKEDGWDEGVGSELSRGFDYDAAEMSRDPEY